MIDPPKNGIHYGIPAAQYHAWNCVSVSWLHKMADSPATLKDWLDFGGDETTESKELGSAVHCAVLEGPTFNKRYTMVPKDMSKRTNAYKAWKAEQEKVGLAVLDEADMRWCMAITSRVAFSQRMAQMLAEAKTEVSLVAEINGIVCKARVDLWLPGELGDLKTTIKSREEFTDEIFRRRWHAQAWWYMTMAHAVGNPVEKFTFVAAHKRRPFLVSYHEMGLDSPAARLGMRYCLEHLAKIEACSKARQWPGYPDEALPVEPPTWQQQEEPEPDLIETPFE